LAEGCAYGPAAAMIAVTSRPVTEPLLRHELLRACCLPLCEAGREGCGSCASRAIGRGTAT
jgi:hypothetical protein